MTDKLEKFKFATIKNVSIRVDELEDKIEIRIEPLDISKEIMVYYKPIELYQTGDFILRDNHKKIEIEKGYPVGTYDGDVDWELECIFPCDRCSGNKKYIEELHEKIKKLKEQINKLID